MRSILAALLLIPAAAAAQPRAFAAMDARMAARDDARALLPMHALAGTPPSALVRLYRGRIARLDQAGPRVNSVLALDPTAPAQALALGGKRGGPLWGMPILIKDNIETAGALPTTAGSLALVANVSGHDAPLVARLRAAGAVVLGKANLSEWANIRSSRSTSGWSAVGGLTRNPHALNRNACGSSSGSGAAVAAGLAAAAIGTETDGSVTCPASVNGIVGFKPTVGLVSRSRVVPISHSQDTPGPMTRDVADAAALLGAIAGSDPADPATADADARRSDYVAALRPDALRGVRVGVLRFAVGDDPKTAAVFEAALADLRRAGAVLVDVKDRPKADGMGAAELKVLLTELKVDLNAYLATAPRAVRTRTLADVIAFNRATPAETRWFGQELFEQADATGGLADPGYVAARATSLRLAGVDGIDAMLRAARADVLVAPTMGPAWMTDLVNGDQFGGGAGAGNYAAVAGYPHLSVPMGAIDGLPVGLSFLGTKWADARVLALGFAYEQASRRRVAPTLRAGVIER